MSEPHDRALASIERKNKALFKLLAALEQACVTAGWSHEAREAYKVGSDEVTK